MHVELDGSEMLLASPDASPLRAVGDSFDMKMDREPLGDIPLGKYEVHCEVTAIEPDSLLEWNVGLRDSGPGRSRVRLLDHTRRRRRLRSRELLRLVRSA